MVDAQIVVAADANTHDYKINNIIAKRIRTDISRNISRNMERRR